MKAGWNDLLNFASKLNLHKVLNAGKVFSSYYLSRLQGKPCQWGLPFSIAIEPTTSCNLRCPECPSGKRSFTRPTGMLQESLFKTTIDQLQDELLYLIFYFQGEPYLHPSFLDMVNYAADKKIYTATSTNGHYLDAENARKTVESGLDRLIISIDGTTQETYSIYRIGGNLNKVLEGARNVVHWKKKLQVKTPHLIFQFLVVRPNEHQLEQVKNLGKELGVDEVRFKTAQVYDFEKGHDLIPENERYSRYRKVNGGYALKNKLLNHCWKLWHSSVITWDGRVIPCCFDKDAGHSMGHLKQSNFAEIWTGEAYMRFRAAVLRSRKETDICKNCTEGSKVWV